MQIVKTSRFLSEFETILSFIAEDSLDTALAFAERVDHTVMQLDDMPYKYRASLKSLDRNVRDLIIEGYVIPYRVNVDKDRIEIIGMFNANEWNMSGNKD